MKKILLSFMLTTVIGGCSLSTPIAPEKLTELKPPTSVQSSATPTATSTTTPTTTPTPTATLTSTPPPTAIPPTSPIPEWPLNVGNYWVYASTVYDAVYNASLDQTETITATFDITDSVLTTEIQDGRFIAQVYRDARFVSGDRLVEFRGENFEGAMWYVISGTFVYRQPEKPNLGQDVEGMWLEYKFPFSKNRCWFPSPENRQQYASDLCNRGVDGPMMLEVPAGKFDDCYEVLTIYLSGGTLSWFCSGVGHVKGVYDHNGTPFGYNEVLVNYDTGQP